MYIIHAAMSGLQSGMESRSRDLQSGLCRLYELPSRHLQISMRVIGRLLLSKLLVQSTPLKEWQCRQSIRCSRFGKAVTGNAVTVITVVIWFLSERLQYLGGSHWAVLLCSAVLLVYLWLFFL